MGQAEPGKPATGNSPPPPDPNAWLAASGRSGRTNQRVILESVFPPAIFNPGLDLGLRSPAANFFPPRYEGEFGRSARAPDYTRPAAFEPPPPSLVQLPQIDLYLYDETLGLDVLVGHIPAGTAPYHLAEDSTPLPYLMPDYAQHQAPAQAFTSPAAPTGAAASAGFMRASADPHTIGGEEPYRPVDHSMAPTPTLVSDKNDSRPPGGTAAAGGLLVGGAVALGAGSAGSLMTGALTGIEAGAISGIALGAAPLVAGAGAVALGGYVLAHPELGRTPVAVQSHPELSGAVTRFSGTDFVTQDGAIGEVSLNVRGVAGAPDRELGGFWVDGGSGLRHGTDGPVLGRVGFEAIKLNADGETKLRELLQSDTRSRAAGPPRAPDLELGGAIRTGNPTPPTTPRPRLRESQTQRRRDRRPSRSSARVPQRRENMLTDYEQKVS